MRLVVAVGGNALLERGEIPLASIQEGHVARAAAGLAKLAANHDLIVTHGNGPQVGLLANESATDPALPIPYPMDVIGAQTQGMIGYFFLQALENHLPGRQVVSLVCQTEVDRSDPAFLAPTKFVGPVYSEAAARGLADERGWEVKADGAYWRRVVASPAPVAVVEIDSIRSLIATGAIVICSGGGGIPVTRDLDGQLRGVEAVVDKDLTAAALARDVAADGLVILTDVEGVQTGFGTPEAKVIRRTTVSQLRALSFPAGSMGPKVDAACEFVESSRRPAMIGRIEDIADLVVARAGTYVEPTT